MSLRRFVVPITVDAGGDATAYSPVVYGHLVSIAYLKTDFADGVDFTVTLETSLEGVWAEANVNAAAIRHPRAATHSTAGVASLYAAAGTAVQGKIAISGERIKTVVASGGVSKSGALHFTIDG